MKEAQYSNKTKKYFAHLSMNYPKDVSPWRVDLIEEFNDPKKDIIDLGCGTGNYLFNLPNKNIYGIDFSKESIDKLKKRKEYRAKNKKIDARVSSILDTPFPNNKFGIAFSFSTLYYIKEIDMLVKELHRIMGKNSVGIFEFGNIYSVNSIWDRIFFHVPQFNWSQRFVENKFKNHGFKIIEIRHRSLIPNFRHKFDNHYVKNRLLKRICFRMIFIVKKI